MSPSYKIHTPEHLDQFISAEIPDPVVDPQLYKIVTELMMHGPCGLAKMKAPCMFDGVCSKHFPKNMKMSHGLIRMGMFIIREEMMGALQ